MEFRRQILIAEMRLEINVTRPQSAKMSILIGSKTPQNSIFGETEAKPMGLLHLLFAAEGGDGVEAGGAPCRQGAANGGNREDRDHNSGEYRNIERLHTKEEIVDESR